MMKNNYKIFDGYIEGYYGRLLSWSDRKRIVDKLKDKKMNFYFYAPKEDDRHRLHWKEEYDKSWIEEFISFNKYAQLNNINLIIGFAPGLSFSFSDFLQKKSKHKISKDLKILLKKINSFLKIAVIDIALLFDDLPNNFEKLNGKISEGLVHAELANTLSSILKKPIYVVPRIYANQLLGEDKKYLIDYGNIINKENITFFSGKNIVSKKIDKKSLANLRKIIPTEIIIWDNFYANDYCPRRLFLGPLTGRSEIDNIMINATGLIETDLLILDIVKATKNLLYPRESWKKVLKQHKIPRQFLSISKYFLKPDFGDKPSLKNYEILDINLKNIDYLLWKWKSPLSREWYSFLLILKHDLELLNNNFNSERIIKTQTKPLANYILNK
jgi:hyaluronoglucosaminidase